MTERLALGALLFLLTVLLFTPFVARCIRHPSALAWLQLLFATSRLCAWLATFVAVPGLVRSSDLVKYYYPQAVEVAQGQVPYVDFATSYGPAFPYLAASLLALSESHASVALVMVIAEIAAVLLFCRFAMEPGGNDERRLQVSTAIYVYLFSTAAFYWSGMMAYNSSIIALFWVVAIGLLARDRYRLGAAAVAGSVMAGKLLGLLVAPIWLADPRRRVGFVIGAALAAAAAIAVARYLGVDLLYPLRFEGDRATAGNLWFLLSAILPAPAPGSLWRFLPLLALAIGAIALTLAFRARWNERPSFTQLCAAAATLGWLFMLLSKKSYPHYLPMFLLLSVAALSAARGRGLWVMLVSAAGAVGIVEPGLWNALGQPATLSGLCGAACPQPLAWLVAADLLLVGVSGYLLAISYRIAIGESRPAGGAAPATRP